MKKIDHLLKEFYSIFSNQNNMSSFKNYYKALTGFVKQNTDYFNANILEKWNLDVLTSLNPDEYVIENVDLSLQNEKNRLIKKYKNIDSLAMSIRDTLWDMVTIYSGKDCPVSPTDELRYTLIKYADGKEKLLLECSNCGWAEDLDGHKYTGPIGKLYPANKNDLKKQSIIP